MSTPEDTFTGRVFISRVLVERVVERVPLFCGGTKCGTACWLEAIAHVEPDSNWDSGTD